jgi:hypothetical protein
MKLLDTNGGNTKIAKTNKETSIRYAGLSLMPTLALCPNATKAGCFDSCLKFAGRGRMSNVQAGRQRKTDWLLSDPKGFKEQLRKELANFVKLCDRNNQKPVVRLNTISDYNWRDIKSEFESITFVDYTKIASRLFKKLSNERLIFSYSGAKEYQKDVQRALETASPIAVVFEGPMPKTFLNRSVVDGDISDWANANAGPVIIGLKAKGPAIGADNPFIVRTNGLIAHA